MQTMPCIVRMVHTIREKAHPLIEALLGVHTVVRGIEGDLPEEYSKDEIRELQLL